VQGPEFQPPVPPKKKKKEKKLKQNMDEVSTPQGKHIHYRKGERESK
jgi:hypothetical protein